MKITSQQKVATAASAHMFCSRACSFHDSGLSSTLLMCIDRDRAVLPQLTMLKYVHVLLCATQCESVNAQSSVCGYFLPLIGTTTGLGCRLLRLDKDAVCGPLLGACVVACLPRPGRTAGLTGVGWGGGVLGIIFICFLPQFKPANTGISQSCFMASSGKSLFSDIVERISHSHRSS